MTQRSRYAFHVPDLTLAIGDRGRDVFLDGFLVLDIEAVTGEWMRSVRRLDHYVSVGD